MIKCNHRSPLALFSVEELKILRSPHRSNPEHSKYKFLIFFWSFTNKIKIWVQNMCSYEDYFRLESMHGIRKKVWSSCAEWVPNYTGLLKYSNYCALCSVQYLVLLLENASYVIFLSPQWSLGQSDGCKSNASYICILYERFEQFGCRMCIKNQTKKANRKRTVTVRRVIFLISQDIPDTPPPQL